MRYLALLSAIALASCSSTDNNETSNNTEADMSMSQPDSSRNSGSADGGGNTTTNGSTNSGSSTGNKIRVDDLTPTGQGLALDAVQNCNQVGMGCVGLIVVASSDDSLDYAGTEDGPNSQDDTCTDMTFTRLGGMGSWVELERPDGEPFDATSQINVWTGDSACSLIEAGDKNFSINIGGAENYQCQGTCTISVP